MALMMAISDILGLIEIARKKSPRLFFARIGQRQKKNEGEREEREKREFIQIFVHLRIPRCFSRVVGMASRLRQPQSTTDKNAAILKVTPPLLHAFPPFQPSRQRLANKWPERILSLRTVV